MDVMMPAGPQAGDAMFPGQGQWIDIPEDLHTEFAQVGKGHRMAALMEQLKTAVRRSGDGRPVFTDGPVESLLARTNPRQYRAVLQRGTQRQLPRRTHSMLVSIGIGIRPRVGVPGSVGGRPDCLGHGGLPDSDTVRRVHHGHRRGTACTGADRTQLRNVHRALADADYRPCWAPPGYGCGCLPSTGWNLLGFDLRPVGTQAAPLVVG